MARKKFSHKDVYSTPMRHRGEEFNEPESSIKYDYMEDNPYSAQSQQRAPRRHEIRNQYTDMYDLEQRRSQRAFANIQSMENEFYGGVDPRRRQEIADGGMVREDRQAMANLSSRAIHCEYPQAGYYATPYIDGIVRGEDPDIDDNVSLE